MHLCSLVVLHSVQKSYSNRTVQQRTTHISHVASFCNVSKACRHVLRPIKLNFNKNTTRKTSNGVWYWDPWKIIYWYERYCECVNGICFEDILVKFHRSPMANFVYWRWINITSSSFGNRNKDFARLLLDPLFSMNLLAFHDELILPSWRT